MGPGSHLGKTPWADQEGGRAHRDSRRPYGSAQVSPRQKGHWEGTCRAAGWAQEACKEVQVQGW